MAGVDAAVDAELVMDGGAMSAMASGTYTYKGKSYGLRELVRAHNKAWAFNGVAGMPDKPWGQYKLGQTVRVRMQNRTAWPHAMHFHGHHVREVEHSARTPDPAWRDTVLMQRGETVVVAFQAHNPGKWMLHCHMLAHQAGGMSTWYEVA
jgi:FtsP/CotA-like multicopper oxidase with cupredoxin domain